MHKITFLTFSYHIIKGSIWYKTTACRTFHLRCCNPPPLYRGSERHRWQCSLSGDRDNMARGIAKLNSAKMMDQIVSRANSSTPAAKYILQNTQTQTAAWSECPMTVTFGYFSLCPYMPHYIVIFLQFFSSNTIFPL